MQYYYLPSVFFFEPAAAIYSIIAHRFQKNKLIPRFFRNKSESNNNDSKHSFFRYTISKT